MFSFTKVKKSLLLCATGKSSAPGTTAAIEGSLLENELHKVSKLTSKPLAIPTERFAIDSVSKKPFLPQYHAQMPSFKEHRKQKFFCIVNAPEGSEVLEGNLADCISGSTQTDNDYGLGSTKNLNSKYMSRKSTYGWPLVEDLSSQFLRSHFDTTDGNDADSPNTVRKNKQNTVHFAGIDPNFGPVAISIFRLGLYSKLTTQNHAKSLKNLYPNLHVY